MLGFATVVLEVRILAEFNIYASLLLGASDAFDGRVKETDKLRGRMRSP